MPWIVPAIFAVINLLAVRLNAVDIPFWDQWEELAGFGHWPTPSFLFAQQNEHRIPLTRLIDCLLARFDGWDQRVLILFNFGLYLAVAAGLAALWRITTSKREPLLWPLLFVPWMSTSADENLLWGFQNQFHFVLLFSVVGIAVMFGDERPRALYRGALWLVASIFSFSSGLPGAVCAMVVVTLFVILRAHDTEGILVKWRRAVADLVWPLAIVAAASAAWLHGFVKPPLHPALALPTAAPFWIYLSHLVARGFGTHTDHQHDALIAIVVVAAHLLSLAVLWRTAATRRDRASWAWATLAAAIFGMLAVISMGRALLNDLSVPIAPRYAEIATMLIFSTGALLYLAARSLGAGCLLAQFPLAILLLFLAVGYRDAFDYSRYGAQRQSRLQGRACVRDFYAGRNPSGLCPTVYPGAIPERLLRARAAPQVRRRSWRRSAVRPLAAFLRLGEP